VYVFLTDRAFLIAFLEGRGASERSPLVWKMPLTEIKRLLCDDEGNLTVVGPGPNAPEVFVIVALWPGIDEKLFVSEFRSKWEALSGQSAEGNSGWLRWKAAPPFPPLSGVWLEIVQEAQRAVLGSEGTATYHFSWGDRRGAIFYVREEAGDRRFSWSYDPGVVDDLNASMIVDQALGELQIALGEEPNALYKRPRPSFMPAFVWTPRLPAKP
jgi:hypothetical protein